MPQNLSPLPPPPSSCKTLTLDATLDLDLDLPSRIAELVLGHAHGDDPRSLALALSNLSPLHFPASLADAVLKRLWDHGPRALLFFRSLLHLPRRHGHGHLAPSASTFDLALDLAARLRDRRCVHSLLLLRRRLLPRLVPSPRTFSLLAERLVLSGKPDRAVRLFLSSPSSLHTPRTFNSLLDALSKSRRVHKATSLFKTLKHRFPPDAATYNILAEGWCRLKRTSQALDLLRDMVASGVAPTKTTYNVLLHGLFRARQTRQALDFFAQMKRRSKTDCAPAVVSYTTVLHALGLIFLNWSLLGQLGIMI